MRQDNRDKRVELLQKYARKFFPATRYLDYAIRVEQYTLTKAANLVLNVDGCIGALFLDLLHSSSMFSAVRQPAGCLCHHLGLPAPTQRCQALAGRVPLACSAVSLPTALLPFGRKNHHFHVSLK